MKFAAIVVALFALVVGVALWAESRSGHQYWRLPNGGRAILGRSNDEYRWDVRDGGGHSTTFIRGDEFPSEELPRIELRTDDQGDYWLVRRSPTPAVFATEGSAHQDRASGTFESDGGRIVPRATFWIVFQ